MSYNTVVNPISTATSKGKNNIVMQVNRTKENETLYYLADAGLLVIATREKKLYYMHGDTAEFMYKKLAVDTEKRKRCDDAYMIRLLNFFYKEIDESSKLYDSMAALETILDKLEQDAPGKGK